MVFPILLFSFKSRNESVVSSKMLPDESGISILYVIWFLFLFDLFPEDSNVANASENVLIPKRFAKRVPTGMRPT